MTYTANDRQTAAELMAAFGVGAELAPGVTMPVPVLGVLALLEQIGSPYLEPGEPITVTDTLNAAYLLFRREHALALVSRITRGRADLNSERPWVETHPELARAYFETVAAGGEPVQEFAAAVDELAALRLAGVPLVRLQAAVQRGIDDAMGGYAMIPHKADPADLKKNALTPPGSPGRSQPLAPLRAKARSALSGTCRWLWRVILRRSLSPVTG